MNAPSSTSVEHSPATSSPDVRGIFFADERHRPLIIDSLRALEEQLYGGAMMPPVGDDALRDRIQTVARMIGSTPEQTVTHWIYWALSGGPDR